MGVGAVGGGSAGFCGFMAQFVSQLKFHFTLINVNMFQFNLFKSTKKVFTTCKYF